MKKVLGFILVFLINSIPVLQAQWIQTSGPIGQVVTCMAISNPNIFGGTSNNGVYLSPDNGNSWKENNAGLYQKSITALLISGLNLFAGTTGTVFLSTNNGTSWSQINNGLNGSITSLVECGGNIFCGTNGYGLFKSTNNGTNWKAINTSTASTYVRSLASSGSIICAGMGVGLSISTDYGVTWSQSNAGLTEPAIFPITISGTNIFVGSQSETRGGIYLSTNNGTSWAQVNSGLSTTYITSLCSSGTSIFAGTTNGVFISTNNGLSWTAANTGLTNTFVTALAVSSTNLFAGTSDGVWRRPLSEMITDVEDQLSNLPTKFAMEQNYPNPFNPTTTISYSVPQLTFVMLKVYDSLGREVSELLNGEKNPGRYEVNFDGTNLSSGVYFYRLTAGSFTQTKKLLLLK